VLAEEALRFPRSLAARLKQMDAKAFRQANLFCLASKSPG
jgi:hypothetical protein